MDLLIATTNQGKFLEIQESLKDFPFSLISLKGLLNVPEVDEDQPTFLGNARKKALTLSQWSGKAALADDSGLVVEALGGKPGIYSARFAGIAATDEQNRQKLLDEMKDVPVGRRQAAFVSVIVVVTPDGQEWVAEGRCEGEIALEPKGTLGFGYDPVFYLPSLKKTMAELLLAEKNALSHRGQALEILKTALKASLLKK